MLWRTTNPCSASEHAQKTASVEAAALKDLLAKVNVQPFGEGTISFSICNNNLHQGLRNALCNRLLVGLTMQGNFIYSYALAPGAHEIAKDLATLAEAERDGWTIINSVDQ